MPPPAPIALAYESDVLPAGGLTLAGLKREYILDGYYEHIYNPVDHTGISRLDKAFNDEMRLALDQAINQNDREFEALDWSVCDVSETRSMFGNDPIRRDAGLKRVMCSDKVAASSGRTRMTTSSCKAASTLGIHSDRAERKVSSHAPPFKRPIGASARLTHAKPSLPGQFCQGTTPGEAASRTTIGYNKGRTASSLMHPHWQASKNPTIQETRLALGNGCNPNITPARAAEVGDEKCPATSTERPQFTSIFYDNESDTEPLTLCGPLVDFDDDEAFELKMDM
ncbi:hypothetical protein NQ176_g5567 [Zarea fungicola]|uniref:Uncharacterized protein n=1 Tax=Zarea fungicola TaxID=93591 RepID=A0ACC1N7X7_9HYPO|nr:hypothetical protein NQ176_g5567 [Lecanicillium fungicola]